MEGLRIDFGKLRETDFRDGKYVKKKVLQNSKFIINLAEECYHLLNIYFNYNFIYNRSCATNARVCFWNKTKEKVFPGGSEVSAGLYFNDNDPGEYLFFQVGLNSSINSEKVDLIENLLKKEINKNLDFFEYNKYKLNKRNGNKEFEFEIKKRIDTLDGLDDSINESKVWLAKVSKIYYDVFTNKQIRSIENLLIKTKP